VGGAVVDIPTGWSICDGTSGTPDLRDRFIVGAGTTYTLGDTGGAVTKTTTGGPSSGRQPNNSSGNPYHNLEGHTHDVNVLPPYYALSYIMKL